MSQQRLRPKAQKIVDWVISYAQEVGRLPLRSEVPVNPRTLKYYFGSFRGLLDSVKGFVGKPPTHQKVRHCRYCHKRLPASRWFFHEECMEPYVEDHSNVELTLQEMESVTVEPTPEVLAKCAACPLTCKIYVSSETGQKNIKATIICRQDPGFAEIAKRYEDGQTQKAW